MTPTVGIAKKISKLQANYLSRRYSGSYWNEADYWDRDFTASHWGTEVYAKLLALKDVCVSTQRTMKNGF
jgi:hypothetical protein